MSGFFYIFVFMEKFIVLKKSSERDIPEQDERWNIKYIIKYRKLLPRKGEKDQNKTIVTVSDPSVNKGLLIVSNSVEDIDKQIMNN